MYSSIVDEHLSNFAHNITVLRQRHGLTKKAMAEILGISLRSVNMLEKGQVPPQLGVEVLVSARAHFHISIQALFTVRL